MDRRARGRLGLAPGWRTAAAALGSLAVVAAADAAVGERAVLIPLLVVGPLVGAVRARSSQVALLGVVACLVGLLLGAAVDGGLGEDAVVISLLSVVAGSALAVAVARTREALVDDAVAREVAERARRRRSDVLARVVDLVETPEDDETLLQRLCSLLVPDVAELVVVDLLEPGRTAMRTVAVDAADPARRVELEAMRRAHPVRTDSEHPVARVARGGQPTLFSQIPEDAMQRASDDAEHRAMIASIGFRSVVMVPLRSRGATVGVLTLVRTGGLPDFEAADLDTARELGARLASTLDVTRLVGDLRASEARLAAVLDNLGEAVAAFSPAGEVLVANRAAAGLFGLPSPEALAGVHPRALADRFVTLDERGEAVARDRIPLARALRGEEVPPTTLHLVERDGGRERWVVVRLAPVRTPEGPLDFVVVVAEDVTAIKREEVRQRFLAGATKLVASSLDLEATLERAAWAAVPDVCDWARVDLLDDRGELREAAVAHRDLRKAELLSEWRRRYPPDPADDRGVFHALRTRGHVVWESVREEDVVRYARTPEHEQFMRDVATRSVLMVPLEAGGEVLGTLQLATTADSERRLGEADLPLARDLAGRVAVAVAHARVHEERSRVATTLQRSLLPRTLPVVPGLDVATRFRAAGGGGTDVGGDFYDLFPAGDGWALVVGDVTGKGPAAAAVTALVRHTARTAARFEHRPEQLLARVNEALGEEDDSRRLCTAVCAVVRPGGAGGPIRVAIASAGHPAPYVLRPDGVRAAGAGGPLLGAFPDAAYAAEDLELAPGDGLVLFTDGVTDTRGTTGRFGTERLEALLAEAGPRDPEAVAARIETALAAFEDGPQRDDVALVVLRARP